MAGKTSSVSARERARSRRAELEEKRRAQRQLIEQHQVAYFAADDDISAFDRKIEAKRAELAELESRREDETQDARERQTLAMGANAVASVEARAKAQTDARAQRTPTWTNRHDYEPRHEVDAIRQEVR